MSVKSTWLFVACLLGLVGQALGIEAMDIPTYLAQLHTGTPSIRMAAVAALAPCSGDLQVRPALIEALRHDASPQLRAQVAAVLAMQSDAAVTDALIGATRESSLEVRIAAVNALRRHDAPGVAEAILSCATHRFAPLRQQATLALIDQLPLVRDARVKDRIIDVVIEGLHTPDVTGRQQMTAALCEARTTLAQSLRLSEAMLAAADDTDATVRQSAMAALPACTPLGPSRIAERLSTAIQDSATPIADMARKTLLAWIQDTDPQLRAAAANGLGGQTDPYITHSLEKSLHDIDDTVRLHAAQALGRSTDPFAKEVLFAALQAPIYHGYRVWLDAGHGGTESGAVANGIYEKNLNLPITLACKNLLEQYGITVGLTRADDSTVDLYARCTQANNWGANYFVSIHNNAGGGGRGDGTEVIHSIFADTGTPLTAGIAEKIQTLTGQNLRSPATYSRLNGAGDDDYYCVIRETDMPAVIVECSFVDNPADVQMVISEGGQRRMGEAIARAVLAQLGITDQTPRVDAKAAEQRDLHVHRALAIALADQGDQRAVPALIDALSWGTQPEQSQVVTALGKMNDPRAIQPLIAALPRFTGKTRATATAVLATLTGLAFGEDCAKWQAWATTTPR